MSEPTTNAPLGRNRTVPDQVDAALAPLRGAGHDQLAQEIRQAVEQSPFLARQFRKAAEHGGIGSISTTSNPEALGSYTPSTKDIAVNMPGLERTASRALPGPTIDPQDAGAQLQRRQDALTWVMGHEVWHADCEIHNPRQVPDLGAATWRAAIAAEAFNQDRPRMDMTSRVNAYLDSRLDEEASAQLHGINALASRISNEPPLTGILDGSTARALLSPGVADREWDFPAQMEWSNRLDWAVRQHQVLERIEQTGMTTCVQRDQRGALTPHEGLHMRPDGTLDERSLPALHECAVSPSYRTLYFTQALELIRHGTETAAYKGQVRLDLDAVGVDLHNAQRRMAELWKDGRRLTIHDPDLGPVTFGHSAGSSIYGRRPVEEAEPGSQQLRGPAPADATPMRDPLQAQVEQAVRKVLPDGATVAEQCLAQFADEARAAGFKPGEPINASLEGSRMMLRGQHPTHVASIDLAAPAAPPRHPAPHQDGAPVRQPEPAHSHCAAMAH